MKRLLKFRLQHREKKVLLIGGLFVTILITFHLFTWYDGMKRSIGDYAEAKRVYLLKQLNKISEKEAISRRLEATKGELRELENGLIKGNKPPLSAAELQRLLKEMAKASGVDIKLERALSPIDTEMYSSIPVEIGFTAITKKLKDMLLMIEASPLLLTISEMKIRVTGLEVYVTITVRGLIRKGIKEHAERA